MSKAKLKILDPAFIGSFFALIAAILAVLTLFTGARPGDLLLFRVNVENFRIPSKLSSSQLLSDIETVSGGDLTGSETSADSLGLAQYYTIHILRYCSYFKHGRKFCSESKVGWWFDPVDILRLDDAGLADKLSEGFLDAIKKYKHAANFIGVGFIIAFAATVLALFLSLFAKRHRGLNIVVATAASVGSAFFLADALTTMMAARKMVRGINNDLEHLGITASNGFLMYFPFIAAALSMIASVTYSTMAHRNRMSGSRHRAGMQGVAAAIGHRSSSDGGKGFSGGQSLLQRVTTWSRGPYVQIERQKSNARLMEPPTYEDAAFLDPADEVRFNQNQTYRDQPTPDLRKSPSQQSLDYKHPSEQHDNDIAMQPLTRRDRGPDGFF